MNTVKASLWLSLCLAGLAAIGAPSGAEDTVRFELCGRKLASVEIGHFGGPQPWAVLVQLDAADAEVFRAATAGHPGAVLEITHGARVFVSGKISGEIRTGLISATYEKKEDAERSRTELRDESAGLCANQAS